ncbi:MAG TPA: HEAT repeat domain-containing protein, partial [Gemmataceae bacterium]|nr:HEAT repeat domain-containing protein [Gemmataceae bacterium]
EARIIVGLNFGFPICRPVYGPAYYPYYRPYPVYVAPAPIYYAPPYYGPPPVIVQPAPAVYQAPPPAPYQAAPVVSNTGGWTQPPPLANSVSGQGDSDYRLQQLFAQDERARADAAIELGRSKVQQAVDPLCNLLSSDRSPMVRETAARALGLIGNARALNALQNAAQADGDRDVRRSAQFSAEVIRANLRKD